MALTTTSYAILGYLAVRPWTMYDLAKQMRRNVHYFFPRAESQLYAEPKRLVAEGLATARKEANGKRARTVYQITDAGRAALTDWLAQPVGKPPTLEFEAILRVMLARFGSDDDLVAVLHQVRRENTEMLDMADTIRGEYLAGRFPFQDDVAHRSIMHDFLSSFADLVDEWAERSAARLAKWPDQTKEERDAEALKVIGSVPRRG